MTVRKVIFGEKAGMTQVFDDETADAIPVTIIESEDCVVVQHRKVDGRPSVQVGFRETDGLNKPERGHFEALGLEPRRELAEFLVDEDSPLLELEPGDEVLPDLFEVDEYVDVQGRTKGRGFSGAIRRWNFSGGPKTHGGGFGRGTGSIGQATQPSRVFPGKKMPGQYGNKIDTMQSLRVVDIFPEERVFFVKGSVPGPTGGTLLIRETARGGAPVG